MLCIPTTNFFAMTQSPVIHHENKSLLAGIESKIIAYLVKILPSWVTPDSLTLLGLYSAIGVGISYYYTDSTISSLYVASVLLLTNWFGDSLDGRVAHYRKQNHFAYGLYFDHIVDAFSVLVICLGITASSLTTTSVWLFVALGYVLYELHISLSGWHNRLFSIAFWKIGPTELRLLLIIINVVGLTYSRNSIQVLGYEMFYYDVVGLLSFILLFIFLLFLMIITMRKLKKYDEAN